MFAGLFHSVTGISYFVAARKMFLKVTVKCDQLENLSGNIYVIHSPVHRYWILGHRTPEEGQYDLGFLYVRKLKCRLDRYVTSCPIRSSELKKELNLSHEIPPSITASSIFTNHLHAE